ncbi:MAG: hypothetical protein AB7G08_23945 [Hyphomicrobiaceae bacterium]
MDFDVRGVTSSRRNRDLVSGATIPIMRRFDERERSELATEVARRFPNGPSGRTHWTDLLLDYGDSGLAPPHLLTEITSGDDHKFWASVWEAMLYRHLNSLNLGVSGTVGKGGQRGPDFRIEYQGKAIWIEAVTPAPTGLPAEWLAPPARGEIRVRSMPHEAMLLRWTSVLRDKRHKLEQYANTGIIGAGDASIVAVNCCCLSDFAVSDHGISQLPFAVEAAFPIGPLGVPISRDGEIAGEAKHIPRFNIRKHQTATVPTGIFLDPSYANVSAVMSAYQRDTIRQPLALTMVHNPHATAPLALGFLGALREYFAEQQEDGYSLRWTTGEPA